ncbi:hypothetical protein D1007_04558 [Hordeum vulgare]|nr:hypothetical protein D1007_04558 [Hordeum vulgare]
MHHAIQGFSGAETWDEFKNTLLRSRLIQKCYDNPKEKTCACKICGEIGHTQEEHKDGCTHCEENHPGEECPSSQVTCFLCEGTTHYPAQCHIYPKVQQVVKQQKDAVKETLKKKILEEPVMNENIEDPDGQGLTRFFSNACYSCGEEGHYSEDCTKESQEYLGNFPTEEVEFDPLEIEELAKIKESGKKKKYPRKSQISADIDLSHVRCYKFETATRKALVHLRNIIPEMADEPATRHFSFRKDDIGESWTLNPSPEDGTSLRFQTYFSLSANILANNLIKESLRLHEELHRTRGLLRLAKAKLDKIKKDGAPEGRPAIAYRGGVPPATEAPTWHRCVSMKEYRGLFTIPPVKHRRDEPLSPPTPLMGDDTHTCDDQEEDLEERDCVTEHSST